MEDVYKRLDHDNRVENQKAEAALLTYGIQSVTPDQGEMREWRRIVSEANRKEGQAGAFDLAVLDQIESQLQTLRAAAGTS